MKLFFFRFISLFKFESKGSCALLWCYKSSQRYGCSNAIPPTSSLTYPDGSRVRIRDTLIKCIVHSSGTAPIGEILNIFYEVRW